MWSIGKRTCCEHLSRIPGVSRLASLACQIPKKPYRSIIAGGYKEDRVHLEPANVQHLRGGLL